MVGLEGADFGADQAGDEVLHRESWSGKGWAQ
jgi:hypothetical protein